MGVLPNKAKRAVREGGAAIGTMISACRNPSVAYMVAAAGFQWVVLDTEHGAFSTETASDFCMAARAAGVTPVIRVPGTNRVGLYQALDGGAQGLLIPEVETREQVETIIHATKYAPAGLRGMNLRQVHMEFRKSKAPETMAALNEETMVIIQIESGHAVENIDALLSVPGVDGAFVGPNDLSQTLGVPGDVKHPLVQEHVHRVIEACKRHGVAPGLHVYDVESACYWLEQGVRYMLYCNDVSFIVDTGAKAMGEINGFLKR